MNIYMKSRIFSGLAGLALLLMIGGPLQAAGPSRDQILDGIAGRYGGVEALQATYSRVAKTPSIDKVFKSGSSQVANGVLYWSQPARLLLDQASPAKETLVTDGSTVWWHLPSEKIVYRYRNIDVAGQLRPLMAFLGGLDSLTSEFNVEVAPANPARPGQYGLLLTPRRGQDGGVDKLTVWCDQSFILTGFRMNSITGESTDFYLTGFKENPRLDRKMFSFKVPRGTEVIDEE